MTIFDTEIKCSPKIWGQKPFISSIRFFKKKPEKAQKIIGDQNIHSHYQIPRHFWI